MKMRSLSYFLFVLIISCTTAKRDIEFTIAAEPWSEGLGNQRAVLQVKDKADAAYLDLLWRRHDRNPEDRRFIIINETTRDTVENVYRIQVTNERCELVIGPVERGTYNFYYLPYKPDPSWGFFRFGYLWFLNKAFNL